MTMDAREIFAVSDIAQAIGWSKARVQTALAGTPRSGTKQVSGNESPAYSVAALPEILVRELERMKTVHFYGSLSDVLKNPTKLWQPAVPLLRVREQDRREAEKLRDALSVALALPEETPIAERARVAALGFQRAFGRAASARTLERHILRTLDRDRGAKNFERLEIYLAESARPVASGARPVTGSGFDELQEELSVVRDNTAPTPEEKAYCWRKVIDFYHARIAEGVKVSRLKRELCAFLFNAVPFLSDTAQGIKRNFNRKLAVAEQEGVAAITDQRATNSGRRRRPADWEWNIQLFAQHTLRRHSRESQAWRELYRGTAPSGEQFSEPFREYFSYDVRTAKSRVPASVRAAIRPMMIATAARQLGPRATRLARPSIPRDWSDTAAGDFYTQDDVTINHLWFEWHEHGEYEFDGRRFNVGRGQWLLCCDERTDFPLGFLLMPSPTYNSSAICTLNARIFSDERAGLPFKGMKYEQGIWKARKIAAQFSWPKISDGFARHGIELTVRHATTPRAKIIERVIGSAQNMMDHVPGYVGRCESKVKFERPQKFLQSLRRVGQPRKEDVDPREMFLSKEEISDELVQVMRAFSEEPQNGERLAGLSPAQAWEQLSPGRPHHVLPESLRYLLTTHESSQTVSHNGVRLKIGNVWHHYVGSERLGELRGEKVRVFYNPELPDLVSVVHPRTDPKAGSPFSVPLFERLPANTATAEDFARAGKDIRAFSKFGANSFRLIAPPRSLTMRNDQLGTPELRETGERLNEIESEHRELKTERTRHRGTIQELAARQNIGIDPSRLKHPARTVAKLRENEQLLAEILRDEAEPKNPTL